MIPCSEVPGFREERARLGQQEPGDGSIIIVVATDAPLLPHQCERLAQRATIGLARVGGIGANSSGDIFLAFATGNRGLPGAEGKAPLTASCQMVANDRMTPLFEACAEATEEAILNALCMATTTVGIRGPHHPRPAAAPGAGDLCDVGLRVARRQEPDSRVIGRLPPAPPVDGCSQGRMFALCWKKFPGSYMRLTSTSR